MKHGRCSSELENYCSLTIIPFFFTSPELHFLSYKHEIWPFASAATVTVPQATRVTPVPFAQRSFSNKTFWMISLRLWNNSLSHPLISTEIWPKPGDLLVITPVFEVVCQSSGMTRDQVHKQCVHTRTMNASFQTGIYKNRWWFLVTDGI